MNKNSNAYTIIYVSVMVVIVAFALAFTAGSLKEKQNKNVEADQKIQILASLNVTATFGNVEELFEQYVKEEKCLKEDKNGCQLPVYICEKEGKTYYILSLRGSGLWGPIWGYISLEDDKNTVYGAYFSHKGETPGLGAEIENKNFQLQFQGKQIFKNGNLKSIAVVKPGKQAEDMDYVDGISGGTITSQGVDKMLYNSLNEYQEFLTQK